MFSFPYFYYYTNTIAQYPNYHELSESSENVKTFFNDSQISMETPRSYILVYLFGNLSNSGGAEGLIIYKIFLYTMRPKNSFFVSVLLLCDVSILDQYMISLSSYFILQSFHFQIGENALFAAAASEHQPLKRSIHQQFLSRFFPYLYYILCLLNFDLLIYL